MLISLSFGYLIFEKSYYDAFRSKIDTFIELLCLMLLLCLMFEFYYLLRTEL